MLFETLNFNTLIDLILILNNLIFKFNFNEFNSNKHLMLFGKLEPIARRKISLIEKFFTLLTTSAFILRFSTETLVIAICHYKARRKHHAQFVSENSSSDSRFTARFCFLLEISPRA